MRQRPPSRSTSFSGMPDLGLQIADNISSAQSEEMTNKALRYILGIFLAFVLLVCLSFIDVSSAKQQIVGFLDYVDSLGYVGPIIYGTVHMLAVSVCFPATILFELGAGFLYGLFGGVLIVLAAKTFGACIAFLLGRTLLRNWVRAKVAGNERFSNVYKNIGKDGWKFAFLLRLSPLPSWLNNYGLALTEIKFSAFIAATMIGTLPMITQHVYVGTLVQHATHLGGDLSALTGSWLQTAFMLVGFGATIVISRMLVKYASHSMPGDSPSLDLEADMGSTVSEHSDDDKTR
eukprot:TRINITY_DN26833_c0_g1_i1.p1 TRINITY_DN26833_c0_g1~~TRINITY_DN26833_c0_g1_i1.p1  ORF type:complete len:290 (-),score=53.98 TRINITY_DN26833_c0_g1_i1:270-1139(-)